VLREAWLVNPDQVEDLRNTDPADLYFDFCFTDLGGEQTRVCLSNPPMPWRKLKYVDAGHISRRYGCTRRTVSNHVRAGSLRPAKKVGNTFYFLRTEVDEWRARTTLKVGRPPKRKE